MSQVAIAIGIMTGLGLVFGGALAVAYHFLKVEEDPRIDDTEALLPGNNCGACGQPGCRAFAEKLVLREVKPGKCTVASQAQLDDIAQYLGVDVGAQIKEVARLKCGGAEGTVAKLATYQGITSCRAAVIIDRGGRACPWGCLGLADCERACTFDAIVMTPMGLPKVDPLKCTACGDCVAVCPLDLFIVEPESKQVFVQCSSPLVGEEATARCVVACDACGLCAKASSGAITMQGGLPVVDPEALELPREAVYKCPTGAIVWLEGAQFEAPTGVDDEPGMARHATGGHNG